MDDTKLQRYAAFLLTYLPRLSVTAHTLDHTRTGARYVPLVAASEYVRNNPGIALEFGVFKGASINHTAKRYPNRKFFGFDSFEGFPDDGRKDWQQDFSVDGNMPIVPENVTLIKGYFSNTLENFLSNCDDEVAIVNVDCDIYSSTKDIFDALVKYKKIKAGMAISFDELISYSNYIWNEMYALFEMLEQTGLGIRWISCHNKVRLIEDSIYLHDNEIHPTWAEDRETGYRQQASLVLTNEPLDFSILELPHSAKRVENVVRFLKNFKSDSLNHV